MSDLRQAAIRELAERIDRADAIVIGGGSGLSSAAGYDHYHWSPALSEALAPFREHYGFSSPLAGFYHCFSSYEEQWGYQVIAFHDRDDALGEVALAGKEDDVLLYHIFKDADALDRFRLGPNGLDARYLRTAEAISLYHYAEQTARRDGCPFDARAEAAEEGV